MDELLPCPFCGFKPDPKDDDCIYPVDKQWTVFVLNCYETGGGCSASILGDSVNDCISKWNKRVNTPNARTKPTGAAGELNTRQKSPAAPGRP